MGLVSVAGAAVGGIGVAGPGSARATRRGVRGLCVAVVGLLLVDPWLARSWGFVLSTVATAGIVLFARAWTLRLERWLPGWLAEAVAVPLAAQVVCTPVIAAISGQVSLVAVLANVLAGPAVGPATVLELLAGAVTLVSSGAGHVVAWAAAVPAAWIVAVAVHGASLPGASRPWPADASGLVALGVACAAALVLVPPVLERRALCIALAALGTLAVIRPISAAPPGDWVMAVCDVGQGDALALNAGRTTAVVVDAGPDPALADHCLARLGVKRIPLLVLTHFHADHVDGLTGVLKGRHVDAIEVTRFREPTSGASMVTDIARRHHVPVTVPTVGEVQRVGQVTLRTIGPVDRAPPSSDNPNDASIVMMADIRGVRILLAGDAQTEEMSDLVRTGADLRCDVYKVAHHGSANVDPRFVAATHAYLAVISVGRKNDYGHPAATALHELTELPAAVRRTDRDGTILIGERTGHLTVTTADRSSSHRFSNLRSPSQAGLGGGPVRLVVAEPANGLQSRGLLRPHAHRVDTHQLQILLDHGTTPRGSPPATLVRSGARTAVQGGAKLRHRRVPTMRPKVVEVRPDGATAHGGPTARPVRGGRSGEASGGRMGPTDRPTRPGA